MQAEQLWDELTDAWRALFNSRIFEHGDSFLSLSFWRSVLVEGVPLFISKAQEVIEELEEAIDDKGGWSILLALSLFTLTLIVVLVVLDRWFTRRWLEVPEGEEAPTWWPRSC